MSSKQKPDWQSRGRRVIASIFDRDKKGNLSDLSKRDGYETVLDDESMSVLYIPGSAQKCLISFTGVGHNLRSIDLQTPEFSRYAGDESKIFVVDKGRTWGNGLDWQKLKEVIRSLAPRATIRTTGNSMGGFLAIHSVPLLDAEQAIAFVPQWSIHPDIIPDENRWLKYRRRISQIHITDLSHAVRSPEKLRVFFGSDPKDLAHMRCFWEAGVSPYQLADCGHNAATYLKERELLYPLLATCLNDGDVMALLQSEKIPVFPH